MKVPGAIYIGKDDRRYLAVYNFEHDIHVKLPHDFNDCNYIAHFSYSKGSKMGGVDIFLLPKKQKDISGIIFQTKTFRVAENNGLPGCLIEDSEHGERTFVSLRELANSGEKYDIRAQISTDSEKIQEEVSLAVVADIQYFCREDIAKTQRGHLIERVGKIVPLTKLVRVNPERLLSGGKQWFVPECVLEANIDFAKGCITGWVPGENPKFDGKFFTDYWSFRWGECEYCYAVRQHKSFPKTIYKFDEKNLVKELKGEARLNFGSDSPLGRPVEVLRFGKRTEPWTPFTKDEFTKTLEAMIQTKTRGVITTKLLPFDRETARLLVKTNSVVLYSQGFDSLEDGALLHGRTNEWRIEQGIAYKKMGVNAVVYLLIVGHQPVKERERRILETARKYSLEVQLLPVRFNNKDICRKASGDEWGFLINRMPEQGRLNIEDNYPRGSYERMGGESVIRNLHPDWINLIKDNNGSIRMCHHNKKDTYCGACFQDKGDITKTSPLKMERGNKKPSRVSKRNNVSMPKLPDVFD